VKDQHRPGSNLSEMSSRAMSGRTVATLLRAVPEDPVSIVEHIRDGHSRSLERSARGCSKHRQHRIRDTHHNCTETLKSSHQRVLFGAAGRRSSALLRLGLPAQTELSVINRCAFESVAATTRHPSRSPSVA
jgi:hypothetical protein